MDGVPDLSQLRAPTIPPVKIRFENVNFDLNMLPDGSECQIVLIYPHPIFPVSFELPFKNLIYLDQFIEGLCTLRDKVGTAIGEAKTS